MGPTEGWAAVFLVLAAIVMRVTTVIAKAIGAYFDQRQAAAAEERDLQVRPPGDGIYRTAPSMGGPRLTIGRIPHDDDVWLIAYLRGGINAVAEVIVSRALVEGFLVVDGQAFRRGDAEIADDTDLLVADFVRALPTDTPSPERVREMARDTARRHEYSLSSQLERMCFKRSPTLVLGLSLLTLAGGLVATSIGAIRIAVREAVTGGEAPPPVVLLVTMCCVVG